MLLRKSDGLKIRGHPTKNHKIKIILIFLMKIRESLD